MEAQKLALLRAIRQKRLAEVANISESYLSTIIAGKTIPSATIANHLSKLANEMCAALELPEPFEPTDFNSTLTAHRELPLQAFFMVQDRYFGSMNINAQQLITKEDNDPQLIQYLRECYHGEYESFDWYGKTIRVSPLEED